MARGSFEPPRLFRFAIVTAEILGHLREAPERSLALDIPLILEADTFTTCLRITFDRVHFFLGVALAKRASNAST